eukprot:6089822-Prymnesium_polylepis.1
MNGRPTRAAAAGNTLIRTGARRVQSGHARAEAAPTSAPIAAAPPSGGPYAAARSTEVGVATRNGAPLSPVARAAAGGPSLLSRGRRRVGYM